ncbi:MAG: cysteine dioxygenase [Pseudomonadota bacterium]
MNLISASDFLDFLTALRAKDFKSDKVDLFLKTRSFLEDTFLPFIHFRDDTYGRNLVYRNEFFELAVLTWLPGHRTPIHDHANQRCWMMVESGELVFKNYESPTSDSSKLRALGPAETIKSGNQVYIDDGLGIHSITNASPKPAVSLHLYAGPIDSCKIYNEATKRFERKVLSYLTEGIWSPEGELIESRLCEPLLF